MPARRYPTDCGRSRRQAKQDAQGRPALPGGPCTTAPHPDWSDPERWAWGEICRGKTADFNERYKKKLNPKQKSQWSNENGKGREISQEFLEMVLLHEPWQGAVSRVGVIIKGAWLPQGLELRLAQIPFSLALHRCRIEGNVNLNRSKIHGLLSLRGSCVVSKMKMHGLDVKESLFLSNGTFAEISLNGTRVDGQMSLLEAQCKKKLSLQRVKIGQSLLMIKGQFIDVDIRGTRVDGFITMTGIQCEGKLRLLRLIIGDSLVLRKAKLSELTIRGFRVGGTITMNGLVCNKKLKIQRCQIEENLFLRRATLGETILNNLKVGGQVFLTASKFLNNFKASSIAVSLDWNSKNTFFHGKAVFWNSRIGGTMHLEGSSFSDLILTGSKIVGDFHLPQKVSEPPTWRNKFSKLVLHHTTVGIVADSETAWPPVVAQEGFSYQYLGKAGEDSLPDLHGRSAKWFKEWLGKLPKFSPQPYGQCAKVLRDAGQPDKANDVLFAGLERERNEAAKGVRWLWLTVSRYVVGYGLGYRQAWAIFWALGLLLVGALVFAWSGQQWADNWFRWLGYSLDHLIPIVQLSKDHYSFSLSGWPRYYFYFHQLAGWFLAFFVVAGISGLTRR